MVAGVHSADYAGKRFRKGCGKETWPFVCQQAVHPHHLVGNDYVCRIPSGIRVGIARGAHQAGGTIRVAHRRLDGEFVAFAELVPPFTANFQYLARKLVPYYHGLHGYVVRDSLVVFALMDGLVGRHTQAVRHHPGKDFIVAHRRKLEIIDPQVGLTVESYGLCLHKDRAF